ncbi:MAG TPA: type II toxin-antitoxin system HicA family toxin [Gemmatimonadales bacterium]|nr:type II toxin-antitoxin system HicA family toxin [Gemmatimonadales bacterium]
MAFRPCQDALRRDRLARRVFAGSRRPSLVILKVCARTGCLSQTTFRSSLIALLLLCDASTAEVASALERAGFVLITVKGSHRHYRRPDGTGRVTIPVHAGEVLAPKTFRSILRHAALSVEELQALL